MAFYANNRISTTSIKNHSTDKKDDCVITTSDIFSLDSIRSTLVRQGIFINNILIKWSKNKNNLANNYNFNKI